MKKKSKRKKNWQIQSILLVWNVQRANCVIQKRWLKEIVCADIVTQLTAVKSSVERVIEMIITENLTECINHNP